MSSAPSSSKGVILHRLCPSCDIEIKDERATCATCGSKLVEVRDEIDTFVGTLVDGRYEIRAKIGQGGMGTVYRAWQNSVGRDVAVKLMDRSFSRDAMAVRRFLREARLASQLSQPNTVSVFDFGQIEDGRLFIAMELIRGRTLHEVVQAEGAFSVERVVRVGVQMCDALEAAHGLGIVHRDMKLENVIVLDHPPGRNLVKVLDFGLAKNMHESGSRATESGIVVGTPRYMSPEASTTGVTGPAGDLYSMGVILGELATGKPLWQGDTLPALIAQKLDPRMVVQRIPAPLRSIVERLLDPDPDRRPTAERARVLLSAIATAEPTAADTILDSDAGATTNIRAPSPPPGATRQLSPNRLATAATETPNPLAMAATETPMPIAPARTRSGTPQPAAPSKPQAPPSSSFGELDRPPARSRWPLLVVAAGAIAAVTITIVIATRGDDAPKQRAAVTPRDAAPLAVVPVDAAVAEVTPDAPPAATPAMVTLTIESEPSGATVVYRGRSGKTPFEIVVERGTKPIELRATLPGRQAKKLSIVPDASKKQMIRLPARATTSTDESIPF